MQQDGEVFVSLYRQGKRAEFVCYWGEGHVLQSPANIRDMGRRICWHTFCSNVGMFRRLWSRPFSLVIAVALLFSAVAANTRAWSAEPPPPDPEVVSRVDQMALLVNRARVAEGLLPLARSPELDAAAEAHSRDMAEKRYLDHVAPDGSTPQDRAIRYGYKVPPKTGWIVVEVISARSADPEGPLNFWLNVSKNVHGKVLRNPRWREMGIGYASGGEFGNYWTVLVGCRPGVLPTVILDGASYRHTEQCDQSRSPALPFPTINSALGGGVTGNAAAVNWTGIPEPAATDWIGLYRAGAADTDYLEWTYVSCDQTPTEARADGTCKILIPPDLAPGAYEFRLFRDNGFERLARSSAIAITQPGTPVPKPGQPEQPRAALRHHAARGFHAMRRKAKLGDGW